MTVRTLVILRHGKSDYPFGVADHARPLAERGEREAAAAGRWIAEEVGVVDRVLCSTATRTRQTLAATAIDADTEYLDELYASSHEDYIAALREHGGDGEVVLVVGHEPSVSGTALVLADDRVSHAAREIERKYPTSAIAVLRFDGEWARIDAESATLVDFHVPR